MIHESSQLSGRDVSQVRFVGLDFQSKQKSNRGKIGSSRSLPPSNPSTSRMTSFPFNKHLEVDDAQTVMKAGSLSSLVQLLGKHERDLFKILLKKMES